MRARVADWIERYAIDRVLTDGIEMVQYVPEPSPPLVVDLCDCESLLADQRAQSQTRWADRARFRSAASTMASLEGAVAERAELLTLITPEDETALRRNAPHARTLVVANGVDTDFFHPTDVDPSPGQIVFTGVMDYEPNTDAVRYLVREILPKVRAQRPDAEFWAVGSSPPADLMALCREPGVHVTGEVDDIRPYVWRSVAFVCPLRLGAGMKNKVLAAMAMGRPVVATSASLNGIDVKPGSDVLVGDSADEFAKRICELLDDAALASALGSRGRERVLAQHSWSANSALLERALRELAPA